MGTIVTAAALVCIVGLVVRKMIRDKKAENPCSVAAIVHIAAAVGQ